MKVFVTGASGFVGQALLEDLIKNQYQVYALIRDIKTEGLVKGKGAIPITGDLLDVNSWSNALKGVDAIIHLAAKIRFSGPLEKFYKTNVTGTRILLEAAANNGIKTFIYVSAAAIALNGRPLTNIDETFQPGKMINNGYLLSKVLAESKIREYKDQIRTFIIRPPIIWGPGMRIMEEFRKTIERMGFPIIGNPQHPVPTCHVKNLTAAILKALQNHQVEGTFLICDQKKVEANFFIPALVKAYGMNPGKLKLPKGAALFMARTLEYFWRIFKLNGDPPMTIFTVQLMGTSISIDDSKIRNSLGHQDVISIAEGLNQLQKKDHIRI